MRGGWGSFRPKRCHHLRRNWARHAFVAAAENCDPPAARSQGSRKFFDDRRLAGAADGEIADADDETAEGALAQNAMPIKKKAQLHEPLVDEGEHVEQRPQERGPDAMPAFEDDVDRELLEIFSALTHLVNFGLRIAIAIAETRAPRLSAAVMMVRAPSESAAASMARANFLGRAERDGADGGTGAAQEGAERAGRFGRGNHSIEKRDELLAERLMQMIGEGAAQMFRIRARQRRR